MILHKITQPAGTSWTEADAKDSSKSGNWHSFCVTPTGRIIAGGSGQGPYDMGIWYSDDNGEHWVPSNETDRTAYSLCTTLTGKILAGVSAHNYGILYSDDNGVNWSQTNMPIDSGYDGDWKLCVAPTGKVFAYGVRLYDWDAGKNIGTGLWYSDDNGMNWTESNLTDYTTGCIITHTGRILVCGEYNGPDNFGVRYSDDNGSTWSQVAGMGFLNFLCITPTGRVLAIDSDNHIWYSDDDGMNWTQTGSTIYLYAACVSANRVLGVSNDGGWYDKVYYSDDNGTTWSQVTVHIINSNTMYSLSNNRVLLGANGIWYSDPVEGLEAVTKYLNKAGTQELITQAKAYVDSLV